MSNNYIVRDSGEREEFSTGARRDMRENKGRYDLIPPEALKRLALVYERGAKKYGENNWQKGINLSRYIDSAIRHIYNYMEGDKEEDHLAHAAWNLFGIMTTEDRIKKEELPEELFDINSRK